MSELKNIKCDICGKFISYKDIENEKAVNRLDTPDSYFSFEKYESKCKNCRKKKSS